MEYKRSVIKTLIELYYVAKEEDTPEDALRFYEQSYKIREIKTVLSAVASLIEEPDIWGDKQKFLLKLEMLIQAALRHFEDVIEGYISNQTQCPLARASFSVSYERFLKEVDCVTACKVETFWKAHRSDIGRLCEGGREDRHSRNKGLAAILDLLDAAREDATAPKTKQNCKRAGDAIIALEMPKEMVMLTLDRAFEGLCPLLGKRVERVPSLAELRRSGSVPAGESS